MHRSEALDRYVTAWSLRRADALHRTLTSCWTATSTYVDPLTDPVRGIGGLVCLILDYDIMFPDRRRVTIGNPVFHEDVACYLWCLTSSRPIRMLGEDFGTSVVGMDYLRFDPSHHISHVVGRFARPGLGVEVDVRRMEPGIRPAW